MFQPGPRAGKRSAVVVVLCSLLALWVLVVLVVLGACRAAAHEDDEQHRLDEAHWGELER